MSMTPSVQLYTFRTQIAEDLDGALARVAALGFTRVEPYDFVAQADRLARAFADNGLTAPSAHAPVIDHADPAAVFDVAAGLGIGTVIDPFVPTERWQTHDDAASLADRVNELAALAATSGLAFGYHNHQWEFTNTVDGRPVFDVFVERLAPEVVLEIDTFWATVAGQDTPAVLRRYGDRVKFIHVKDGRVGGSIATALPDSSSALVVPDALAEAFRNQTPAGQGEVDVPAILAAAPEALRVVEFDDYDGDIYAAVGESLAWLAENDR